MPQLRTHNVAVRDHAHDHRSVEGRLSHDERANMAVAHDLRHLREGRTRRYRGCSARTGLADVHAKDP